LPALLGSAGLDCSGAPERLLREKERQIEAFEWVRRLVGLGQFSYAFAPEKNVLAEPLELLRQGQLPYCFGWPSHLTEWPPELLRQIRLLPFPRRNPAEKKAATPFAGKTWCVPGNAEDPLRGEKLLKLVLSPRETRRRELKGGFLFSASKGLWHDPKIQARFPVYRFAADALRSARPFAPDPADSKWRSFYRIFFQAMLNRAEGDAWFERLLREFGLPALQPKSKNPAVQKALDYVETRLETLRNVSEIAAALCLNPNYFNQVFRKETGFSCWAWVKRKRMERARRLLLETPLTVKEVALRLGFQGASAFSRAYRSFHGEWPSQARKGR
jgi:AraC-like DNA-binding protein